MYFYGTFSLNGKNKKQRIQWNLSPLILSQSTIQILKAFYTRSLLILKSAFSRTQKFAPLPSPDFLLIRFEAQTLSLWVLLMKTRASLNNASFFRRLNQIPQLMCINSSLPEGRLVLVIVKGRWTRPQTPDQHWPRLPSFHPCYVPNGVQGFESLSSQKPGDLDWALHGIQKVLPFLYLKIFTLEYHLLHLHMTKRDIPRQTQGGRLEPFSLFPNILEVSTLSWTHSRPTPTPKFPITPGMRPCSQLNAVLTLSIRKQKQWNKTSDSLPLSGVQRK